MAVESTDLERQLRASLLAEQLTQLVLFSVLALKAELTGDDQPPINVTCLREWSLAASALARSPEYAARDRAVLTPHIRRALLAWVDREDDVPFNLSVVRDLTPIERHVLQGQFGGVPTEGEKR